MASLWSKRSGATRTDGPSGALFRTTCLVRWWDTGNVRLRSEEGEGRTWDWPHWTGPGAGALLGVGIAARVDDRTVGVLGGLAVFAMFTLTDFLARRRTRAAGSVHPPDGLPTSSADRL